MPADQHSDEEPNGARPDSQQLKMLDSRSFSSGEDPILYHYCSPATLLSILESRNLRYSDLSRLNDAEERVWGRRVFMDCLGDIRNGRGVPKTVPPMSDSRLERLEAYWLDVERFIQPFACCFSVDGDSLSQWRAYSADGEGFAIGLRRKQISGNAPAQTMKFCYDIEVQRSEMFEAISLISESIDANGPVDAPGSTYSVEMEHPYDHMMADLIIRSVAFKNPAFRDEKEVRSIYAVFVSNLDGVRRFAPTGGYVNGTKVDRKNVSFQPRGSLVVPYVDWPFTDASALLLAELHLGPKCRNSVDDMQIMLNTLGYTGVSISSAGAAYR